MLTLQANDQLCSCVDTRHRTRLDAAAGWTATLYPCPCLAFISVSLLRMLVDDCIFVAFLLLYCHYYCYCYCCKTTATVVAAHLILCQHAQSPINCHNVALFRSLTTCWMLDVGCFVSTGFRFVAVRRPFRRPPALVPLCRHQGRGGYQRTRSTVVVWRSCFGLACHATLLEVRSGGHCRRTTFREWSGGLCRCRILRVC